MPALVFLLDVDNTLIDNDKVKEDFSTHLQVELGPKLAARFWELYEEARKDRSVVDIPLTFRRLREETPLSELDEQTFLHTESIFDNYPFYNALYPHTLETLHHLCTMGLTVIVSDGDQFFQSEKIFRSDLAEAVEGRVLIYTHKQQHLEEILQKYPADHYVMIDDKPDILVDSKGLMGKKLTTVFVEQGHYAKQAPDNFTPDIHVLHIGDLRNFTMEQFLKS
ncbi:MAG TPA: HAD family hydrolase [Ktedonobacteraceae bacterium]|jgi:FMN phosphatase YigB (HAD superfamily)|nr:HAD family hydrolase [Ktedonobacteraceae bacterium]